MTKLQKQFTAIVVIIFLSLMPSVSYGIPQDGTIVGGTGSMSYSTDALTVDQSSARMIVNWNGGFSISHGETVTFNQASGPQSIALNRDFSGDSSQIFGALNADGRIFLINSNGILFGPGSQINVGGLMASTLGLTMSDAAFMAGSNNFVFAGQGESVANYGHISLNAPGGYVALLGATVKNAGVISVPVGKVILAAGERMTVDLDPLGLISVAVDIEEGTDHNPDDEYAAVTNRGTIHADDGKVVLSANVLDEIFDSAVNNDGIIEANSLVESEATGQVLLTSNQNIELNGAIYAQDGTIEAYADQNIILGKEVPELTFGGYSWKYLSGKRTYDFKEFGYYYDDDGLEYVILSQGEDIGKDGESPTAGAGMIFFPAGPEGLYTVYNTGKTILTFYEDPLLNPDGFDHVNVTGSDQKTYSWEDMYKFGDKDFDDVVMRFFSTVETLETPSAVLSASDIFLTADNGSVFQQGGDIYADQLALETNTGVAGTGTNGGLLTFANNVSAVNKSSGDIRIDNRQDLSVGDLSGEAGLLPATAGNNGILNQAVGGIIDISAVNLNIDAPVESFGPVVLTAQQDIVHAAKGDVTIHNDGPVEPPINLASPSHAVGIPSLDNTVDVAWSLPEALNGFGFIAAAGEEYVMAPGSEISTGGGSAGITAQDDVTLALVDAGNADVQIVSQSGSIVDGDLGSVPADFDVIGHTIQLSAAGDIGGTGPGEEIDYGAPYDFSYQWDSADNSAPDNAGDSYTATFNTGTGQWAFSAVSNPLTNGDWWFHVVSLEGLISSLPAHLGPFIIDSPVPPPGLNGFWENIEDELRVYYEILDPSQFLSFEPATKLGLYAYHPLTTTDASAFDGISLDIGAYEFIENNLDLKKKVPYLGVQ